MPVETGIDEDEFASRQPDDPAPQSAPAPAAPPPATVSTALSPAADASITTQAQSAEDQERAVASAMASQVGGASTVREEPDETRVLAVRDKKWQLVEELPGAVMVDLGTLDDPSVAPGRKATVVRDVLDMLVAPELRQEWHDFLRYTVPVIGIEEMNDLVKEALPKIVGRPTQQS